MINFNARKAGLRLGFTILLAAMASGQANADALDDIKERGTINVGVLGGEPPWGFADEKGQPAGVDIDVANLLAEALGVEVHFEPIIVSNRIPSLLTGKVDVLLASMGMYPDRAEVVQFSRPYAANINLVVARQDADIKSYEDLKSYRVGVNRGNSIDMDVTKNAPAGTNILRFDDDASVIQALRVGQVDAVGLAIYPLSMLKKNSPELSIEQKFVVNDQWNGVAMRQGEVALNAFINSFLDDAEEAGKLHQISEKWLGTSDIEFPTSLPDIPFSAAE
jgi:polar amino acid transport system substrate-binding protein